MPKYGGTFPIKRILEKSECRVGFERNYDFDLWDFYIYGANKDAVVQGLKELADELQKAAYDVETGVADKRRQDAS